MAIDKCLDRGGRWNTISDECDDRSKKASLDLERAYDMEITNDDVVDFIKAYISAIEEQVFSTYILTLTVSQVNNGTKYTIDVATHEIYANLGSYNYHDQQLDELESQLIYAKIEDQIVLIKSGIEKLNTNVGRHEFILDLISDRINLLYKTRIPDEDGHYEINPPPTQHFDFWEMYECNNKYEIVKKNGFGKILNGKQSLVDGFCN